MLICSFLSLAAGALQPFESKPYQLYLCAPLVLRGESALRCCPASGDPPCTGPGSDQALLPCISSQALASCWCFHLGPHRQGLAGGLEGAGPAQPWKVAPFMPRAWSLMPRWVRPVARPPSARALACYFFSTVLWPVWTSSMLLPFCNFYFFNRSYHLGLFSFCIVSTREHYGVVSNLEVAKVL